MRVLRGITITELVVVIVVICVLSALMVPSLFQAKASSQMTSCISNLKQISAALELYRSEHDGAAFGTAASMGLPPTIMQSTTSLACADNRDKQSWPYIQLWQGYVISDPQNTWKKLVDTYQDGTPLVLDVNHNDPSVPMFSPYFDRDGLVLFLNGNVRKLKRRGDLHSPTTWAEK
jgi:type II secretory pathway pseudopilin PulG